MSSDPAKQVTCWRPSEPGWVYGRSWECSVSPVQTWDSLTVSPVDTGSLTSGAFVVSTRGASGRVVLEEEPSPRVAVGRRPVVLVRAGREGHRLAGGVAVVDLHGGAAGGAVLLVAVRDDLVVVADGAEVAGDDQSEHDGPSGVDGRDEPGELLLLGPAGDALEHPRLVVGVHGPGDELRGGAGEERVPQALREQLGEPVAVGRDAAGRPQVGAPRGDRLAGEEVVERCVRHAAAPAGRRDPGAVRQREHLVDERVGEREAVGGGVERDRPSGEDLLRHRHPSRPREPHVSVRHPPVEGDTKESAGPGEIHGRRRPDSATSARPSGGGLGRADVAVGSGGQPPMAASTSCVYCLAASAGLRRPKRTSWLMRRVISAT